MIEPVIHILVAFAIFGAAFLLMVIADLPREVQHKKWQEESNIRFFESVKNLDDITVKHGGEKTCFVKYIVPAENQSRWNKWIDRISICAFCYTSNANNEYDLERWEYSLYTKSISNSKFFYMKMKGYIETDDILIAREALRYLNWNPERMLPE